MDQPALRPLRVRGVQLWRHPFVGSGTEERCGHAHHVPLGRCSVAAAVAPRLREIGGERGSGGLVCAGEREKGAYAHTCIHARTFASGEVLPAAGHESRVMYARGDHEGAEAELTPRTRCSTCTWDSGSTPS